jgi:hypothetical protein
VTPTDKADWDCEGTQGTTGRVLDTVVRVSFQAAQRTDCHCVERTAPADTAGPGARGGERLTTNRAQLMVETASTPNKT